MSFPADNMGGQPNYSNSQPQTYPHPGYSRSFGSLPGDGYGAGAPGAAVGGRNAAPVAVYEGGGKAQIYTVCSTYLLTQHGEEEVLLIVNVSAI